MYDDEPGTPNIEALEDDELVEVTQTFLHLAEFCVLRAIAKRSRETGEMKLAFAVEPKMEAIYKSLPNWARW